MMSKGTPGDMTVNAWYNGPTAVADAKAALFGGGQQAAAAAADGVHIFTKTTDGTINENLNAYPPGVTLADMPATQVWVTPPPVVVKPVVAAATTPNAKAWVGAVTDTFRIPTGPGTFDVPLPTSPAPVKGCIYLSCADDSSGNMMVNAFIHDGTNWQAPSALGFAVPEKPPSGTPDAPQIKAYYFGDSNAARNWGWDQGDEMTASAESDGIHLFTEDEHSDVSENTVPYPAGVTMADMPASKTF
jgi:hypothetical protein